MGGRGVFSGANGKSRGIFGNGGYGKESEKLHPAKINRLKATGDLDKLTKHFKDVHDGSAIEYGVAVDRSGYGASYRKGNSGSVNFGRDNLTGKHIIHNHPKGGWANFSGEDLKNFAESGASGVTAVSRKVAAPPNASTTTKKVYSNRRAGTYKIERTGRFKQSAFVDAIEKVKVHDHNYDLELHKWLMKNQHKYGYKYSYKKSKR